jgi:hypothetical protein
VSVHVIDRKGDATHEVRWRTLAGAQRSARFDTAEEAEGFDAAIRARLALDRAEATWSAVPARWKRYVATRRELR